MLLVITDRGLLAQVADLLLLPPTKKGRVPRGDMRSGCAPANVCYGMPSVPARMCYAPGKVV